MSTASSTGIDASTVDQAPDMARTLDAASPGGNGYSQGGPTYEQIAEAAYQRYLRRGGEHGRDFDDWVEAEQELKNR